MEYIHEGNNQLVPEGEDLSTTYRPGSSLGPPMDRQWQRNVWEQPEHRITWQK